ncbi:MAG: glycosyl hydrolase family 28-related protein, partial [Draconibacterium sp.]
NKDAIQRGTWVTPDFQDGTYTTFYSGIDNINFEIADGNPAAIAVRYHIAQVCALKNIDFNIGNGLGAVEEMGNIIENCTFRGGSFGIKTGTSAPGWQCMVLDCSFNGQRQSAIICNRAQMLVIHGKITDTPVGITVPHSDAV